MKATFQYGLASMTGKNGEIVYCLDRNLNRVYVRRYVYPELSEHHHYVGSVTKHLFALQPSAGYIEDMKLYLLRYRSLRFGANVNIRSWSNLYSKLMRDMAKADSSINLLTITREEIYTRDLPLDIAFCFRQIAYRVGPPGINKDPSPF